MKIKKVDFKIDDNTEDHNTDQYEITDVDEDDPDRPEELVVRRGQPFKLILRLSREFDKEHDKVKLIFETCKCII